MKKTLLAYLMVFAFLMMIPLYVMAEELVIFKEGLNSFNIPYQKCGNPNPDHLVKVENNNNGKVSKIIWMWENKQHCWCGWGSNSLPTKDISRYLNSGYLVIKYTGIVVGKLPEVKFIDKEGKSTKIISFEYYLLPKEEGTAVRTVKIPIRKFFGSKEKFYPADPANIEFIQFDAEFHSTSGDIEISYIGFER